MKLAKIFLSVSCFFFIWSCQNPATDSMLIGVWVPYNNKFGTNEQIVFTKDGEMLAQSVTDNAAKTERTLKFKISDNKKILIVDDGEKKEQLEIIELNNSTLKLKRYSKSDTAIFNRK